MGNEGLEQKLKGYSEKLKSATAEYNKTINAAEHIFDGFCASKIDKKYFFDEKKYRAATPEGIKRILDSREEAAGIEVRPPKGMSEKDVSTIVLSALSSDEYMEKSYIDSLGAGQGSTLPPDYDKAGGGLTNFTENFSSLDERMNMSSILHYVPDARRDANKVIAQYNDGDKKPLYDMLTKSLHDYMDMTRTLGVFGERRFLFSAQSAIRMFDVLNSPEMQELGGVSEADKSYMHLLSAEVAFMNKTNGLRKELYEKSIEKLKNNPEANINDDPEIQEKLVEYLACKRHLKYESMHVFDKKVSFGVTTKDMNAAYKALSKRDKFVIEDLLENHQDTYLDTLKAEVRKDLKAMGDQAPKSYDDLLNLAEDDYLPINKVKGSTLLGDLDKNNCLESIKRELENGAKLMQAEGHKPETELYEKILNSKLFKNPPLSNTPTKEEMERRIADCEEFVEMIDDMPPIHGDVLGDLAKINDNLSESAGALKRSIKVSMPLLTIVNDVIKKDANIKTFEKIDKIREEQDKAVEALGEEELVNGMPTKDAAIGMFSKEVGNLSNLMKGDKSFSDVIDQLNAFSDMQNGPIQDEVFNAIKDDLMKSIEKKQDELNEKMLDDDSPELQQKLSALNRVMENMEILGEARKLDVGKDMSIQDRLTASCEILKNPDSPQAQRIDAVTDILASSLIDNGMYKENSRDSLKAQLKTAAAIENLANDKAVWDEVLQGFDPKKPGTGKKLMDQVSQKATNYAAKNGPENKSRQRQVSVEKTNEKNL